ncbi:MAG: phosphoheptose isomerase [Rhodospirillaceae bacterium]|jgi:D-sedoheptulose 7-phosphate isomerase|nr:phosphoheptose isomerase [Rhodospirillaceae bacterium]|tara:strand:- start:2308 stop:2904 length:597 start_codon:yes stop_codon:yes gene_type:complete
MEMDTKGDLKAFLTTKFQEHEEVARATAKAMEGPFCELVALCSAAISNNHKLVFFGNGGSAADAQHLAAELCGQFSQDRTPLPGLALTTDTSALTAIGNDYGFEHIFARQILALGQPGDVALGISTSGTSANVLRGLKAAREVGMATVGFGGGDGGKLGMATDLLLIVPSAITARIQEMHITLGHLLCAALEKELGLV